MQTVVVRHPPKFGAKVASYDDTAELEVPGVEAVREIPQGVANYTSTAAALKGREALSVVWDEGEAETRSSAEIFGDCVAAAEGDGREVQAAGDAAAGIRAAETVYEAEFCFPFLAHAPFVAYFEEMMLVFEHPRCLKCHPVGEVPMQGDDMQPHQPPVVRGDADFGAPGMRCSTCHGPENPEYAPGDGSIPGHEPRRLAPI